LIGTKLFSTTNRLFIGLFGILMLPLLTLAIVAYILAFLAGTPYDIDGIREPVAVRSSSFYNLRRYISILRLASIVVGFS
jgi:hypothetical protein